ncbi:hypothetical protein [Flavobacterium sp.]|uniref:hypothetical protein n=1 Tax=Flavobacterium sp. TaxID=239 RepID=UPI002609B918|nr:hypothetical protein [Flavobacterium sp.]
MKKIIFLLLLSFSIASFSQQSSKITTKKCIPKKGFHLKLVNVLNDSRCPEDVTCVWPGEVSVVVAVYNDKKFIEEKTILFNSKNREENLKWFENYYTKKIKRVLVVPYPKEGVVVKSKNKFIEVVFQD